MAPQRKIKAYVDTNVLAKLLFKTETFHRDIVELVRQADVKGYKLVISDLVLLELSSVYDRVDHRGKATMGNILPKLLNHKSITFRFAPLPLSREGVRLASKEDLTSTDLLHLTTANRLGCNFFITFDRVLLELKHSPVEVVSPKDFVSVARGGN